ncbi:hypothetical protein Tco_0321949 [Tanacetum coccineum]
MLKIYPKLPGQKFEEPPLEEDIISFIRDLRHTGEIKFLSDVNVNHMHQPWRSFAAIINKCLSRKTTALESLRLSRAQILWGHVSQQAVIVDYFMAKDQAIPRRNKMFWHYDRDDFMFTTIRVISKHKDTQEYGAILPQHLTNQAMLESEAFKTYRAYATGEKAPKSKATKKKTDSESSPKTKPSPSSKGKRIKTSAKGDKPATTKLKGLTMLSKVALSEAEQMKLATKQSLIEFYVSHASSSGDGVDLQSKVPNEQQQTGSGTNEGASDKPEVPDVPEYRSESEEESWTFSQGKEEDEDDDEHNNHEDDEEHDSDDDNDDNDDEDDDQENDNQRTESNDEGDDFVHPNLSTYITYVSTPPDYELIKEDENQEDDDTIGEDQKDEDNGELYGDLNLNLDRQDAEMTDAQTNQEMDEAHVTLTIEPPVIPNFTSLFGFERRVSLLESDLSELKQTNQFAEALSSILSIVDKYLKNKTSYAVASSLSELELKKILMDKIEENNSIDRSDVQKNLYRALLEAYNSDKDLLSSYGEVVILKRGHDDQDKDEEPSAGSNRGSKRQRSDKEESSKEVTQKKSKSTSSSKGNDDVSPIREVTDVDERLWNPSGSRTPDREWNQTKTVDDRPPQQWMTNVVELEYHLEEVFKATNDQLDWHNPEGRSYPHDHSKPLPLIPDAQGRLIITYDHFINNDLEYIKGGSSSRKYTTSITKTKAADYGHVKRIEDKIPRSTWSEDYCCYKSQDYGVLWLQTFGRDHSKLTNLNVDERFALSMALRMYMRRIVIQERVEDLQLAVKSYQKKINLTKPDTYRIDLRKMTPYTAYRDIQGIIYQDDMDRNRLMRTDELYKFSDGTLNHVRTSLNDIATGIQMEYLPKRKWTKQDKQRARVMIKAIDKKLKYRRLMRSLEKFVGGRPYRGDLRLLQRTI